MVHKINPSPQIHGENRESEQVLRDLILKLKILRMKNDLQIISTFLLGTIETRMCMEYILGACPEGGHPNPPPLNTSFRLNEPKFN